MNFLLTFITVSALVFSSLFVPAPSGAGHKDTYQPKNMSPCFEEDAYACRASGGTFNWSHCTCE